MFLGKQKKQSPEATSSLDINAEEFLYGVSPTKSFFEIAGEWLFFILNSMKGMFYFIMIVLGVYLKKRHRSRRVIGPLIRREILTCGLTPLLIVLFFAFIVGILVVGQSVVLSGIMGASGNELIGMMLVLVIFKEVGPLVAALVLLVRVGVSTVVELAAERAFGRMEAIIALGIDPIQFYVIPRIIGMGIATFCLTVYFITFALLSGYGMVFFMDVPWKPLEYVNQVVAALQWQDFLTLSLKTMLFGGLVAVATCYESLAKPLKAHEVPNTIIHTVIDCLIGWGLIEVVFYLIG